MMRNFLTKEELLKFSSPGGRARAIIGYHEMIKQSQEYELKVIDSLADFFDGLDKTGFFEEIVKGER